LHHYRFQVWHWRQQTLPVRLPAGARPLAAKGDGRWVSQVPGGATGEGMGIVTLPVREGTVRHPLEIIYAPDGPAWEKWAGPAGKGWAPRAGPRRDSAEPSPFHLWEPELPIPRLAFRHTWCLPPGIAPLWTNRYQQLPGGRNEPGGNFPGTDWTSLCRGLPAL